MHLTQLEAFGLTLAVESVAAVALAPVFRISRGRAVLSAVLGSSLTHPLLWYSFYKVYPLTGSLTTPVLEAFVILGEAPFYRVIAKAPWVEALLLSLLINAASWAAGELIYALL
ncbi:MAG: hypothetical protein GC190_15860 [Alphaproteobacteria bacterium]|nr:hypothetical protein [Alphaproteobacteria bacterium]